MEIAEPLYSVKYGSSKVSQIISVMKTKTLVFLVSPKHELICQNELILQYHFSGNTSLYVFITEIICQTFDVIIDDP